MEACSRLPRAPTGAHLVPRPPCSALSLRRAAARTATAAAAALLGLLPAGASRAAVAALASAAEGVGYDLDFDGASPEVLEVMFVVVATYFGLMVLYIWLASMIDEDPDTASHAHGHTAFRSGGAAGRPHNPHQQAQQQQPKQQQLQDQEQLPTGYARHLRAHIRSAREPRRGHELVVPATCEDGGPCSVEGVKANLAGQAADYVAQQVKDCGSVVRRKLYLRRMAAQDAAQLSPRSGFAGPGASQTPAAAAVHASGALGLGLPGQMEAWVDDWLDALGPAALAAGSEDGLVRAIMADAAPRLAVGEVSELIRSTRSALDQRQKQDDAAFPGYGLWP
ncbi:hypothetical protein MNEG_6125 [Monoraphidium neglectum]|uniref:Uncharacterized protein n=1 Tax=Monoraphidium neglectum TaxID=145388 RepID=A0A0D2JS50_9CHLO|nr:hypothetical protein MNEG_6125 [Monoraphidium neglectum]KIZ01838.1 hypothetical protein MNEG_6125 [Monoraphidium neglectum]|eukprot:XP_013900857.1 hypothetical protein MNEG_6125 [Monoraphidium neglectum]